MSREDDRVIFWAPGHQVLSTMGATFQISLPVALKPTNLKLSAMELFVEYELTLLREDCPRTILFSETEPSVRGTRWLLSADNFSTFAAHFASQGF